jgi:hypothetical protein
MARVKSISQYCSEFSMTPSAKREATVMENLVFPEGNDPFRHFSWRAEGGGGQRKRLRECPFWPSANCLPWRKGS